MPTVEEIVEEVRLARTAKMAELVKLLDLAAALGKSGTNVARTCRKMGVKYVYSDIKGAAYLTRADAAKIAERLA
jgi:hypothetical protein